MFQRKYVGYSTESLGDQVEVTICKSQVTDGSDGPRLTSMTLRDEHVDMELLLDTEEILDLALALMKCTAAKEEE